MRKLVIAAIPAFAVLTGCATYIKGSDEDISIRIEPRMTAHCLADNGNGAWTLPLAPGHLSIQRAKSDMTIECTSTGGTMRGQVVVKSSVDRGYAAAEIVTAGATAGAISAVNPPMAAGTVLGLSLGGGVFGTSFDASTGALFGYPSEITVHMRPAVIVTRDLP